MHAIEVAILLGIDLKHTLATNNKFEVLLAGRKFSYTQESSLQPHLCSPLLLDPYLVDMRADGQLVQVWKQHACSLKHRFSIFQTCW